MQWNGSWLIEVVIFCCLVVVQMKLWIWDMHIQLEFINVHAEMWTNLFCDFISPSCLHICHVRQTWMRQILAWRQMGVRVRMHKVPYSNFRNVVISQCIASNYVHTFTWIWKKKKIEQNILDLRYFQTIPYTTSFYDYNYIQKSLNNWV